MDLPLLRAVGLEHEHVVGVAVQREPLRARRREVGVGLARVAERGLELSNELAERFPVAMQTLQDERRTTVEELDDLTSIDEAGEGYAGQRGRPGEG